MLGDDGPEHFDRAAVGRGHLDRPVGQFDDAVVNGAVGPVGQGGGWSLLEGYQTKLTGLSAAEIQSLFLARPPRLTKTRAHDEEISGLNHTAFDLAVYASQ